MLHFRVRREAGSDLFEPCCLSPSAARDQASSSRHSSLRKYRRAASPFARFSLERPQTADEISDPAQPENDPADEWRERSKTYGESDFRSRSYRARLLRLNCSNRPACTGAQWNPATRICRIHGEPLSRFPFDTRDWPGTWLIPRPRDQCKALDDPQTLSSHCSIFFPALSERWSMIPLELHPPAYGIFGALLNSLYSIGRVRGLLCMRRP